MKLTEMENGKMDAGKATTASAASASKPREFGIRKHVILASTAISMLAFAVGGWASTANLSGAVIAPGQFVVEKNVKKVQHSYGGIVAEINVKNGDRVKLGDVLVRLDATQTRAELGVITSQLVELTARTARLIAERDGLDEVVFSPAFLARSQDAQTAANGEARLFSENRKMKDSQKHQLGLRVEQLNEEIIGLTAQRDAKHGELGLIKKELASMQTLDRKSVV